MSDTEIATAERAQLEEGWEWLKAHPHDPGADAFFNERWLPKLRAYERLYGMDDEKIERLPSDGLPPPSSRLEEMRLQLLMDGIGDVDPLDRTTNR